MHPTQHDILTELRQDESRKFHELLSDVAETSDNLTYHLKQLQKRGFIKSLMKGEYALDSKGIIYLNNNLELNHDLFPTVSCMLELYGSNGTLLMMRKLKQPYLGSVHLPTFGVTSSESLQAQITGFLNKYQIAASHLEYHGLHRERSSNQADLVVFDKFFVVFRGEFSLFKEDIGDRRFTAMNREEAFNDPELLSASRSVLSSDFTKGFTENESKR